MTVKIYMENVYSHFENLPNQAIEKLTSIFSYQQTDFFGGESQNVELFSKYSHITYTGLVPKAIGIFKQMGIKYEIIDNRVKHEKNTHFKLLPEFKMRDYQEEIVQRANSRACIQSATGSGKTFIMYNLIKKFGVSPVVVIAPKVSLAEQIKKEFEKFSGEKIGLCTGKIKDIKDITICTPQSAPEELLKITKAIFYDEVHNIAAPSIFNTSQKAINAYYRIGVSATPWRDTEDEILIEAALSIRNPQLSINASKLIKLGYLVPCNIHFISFKREYEWQGSYEKTYDVAITFNEERNNLIADLAYKATFIKERTTLILIKKIEHGKMLKEKIIRKMNSIESKIYNEIEISQVEFLSGKDSSERRDAVIQAVKDGFTKILIGSTIADEGLDCPILDCLILAGSGKSSTKAFQRIGRVLRLHLGKKNALIFDFMDETKTFLRHSLTRKALYETEPLWNINVL